MTEISGWTQTYMDLRPISSTDQVSLDLTRHLQYRLGIGATIIVADNPRIFLSVVRRRWKSLLREVATQRSYTIDGRRRRLLAAELDRLSEFNFSSKLDSGAQVLVLRPDQAATECYGFSTLYVTARLGPYLLPILDNLQTPGLLVAYQDAWEDCVPRLRAGR
jgi:hypothetical protein